MITESHLSLKPSLNFLDFLPYRGKINPCQVLDLSLVLTHSRPVIQKTSFAL